MQWVGRREAGRVSSVRRRAIATDNSLPRAKLRLPIRRLVAIAVGVCVVGVVVRAAIVPLELPLAELVERTVRERTGADVAIGAVAVGIGWCKVRIVLRDISAQMPGVAASVGEIAVAQTLSGRDVEIGGVVLRVDPSAGGAAPLPVPGAAIAAADAALAGLAEVAAKAGIGTVAISGSRLDVVSAGRPVGEARVFQDVSARFGFQPSLAGEATMVGAGGPIRIRIAHTPDGTGRRIEAAADGIVPADLGPSGAVQSGFTLAPRLVARVAEGRTTSAEGTVDIAEGTMILGTDPMRRLDSGRIDLALAPDGRTILVRPSRFAAGRAQAVVSGEIVPGEGPGDPMTFALAAPGAVFDSADIGRAPVVVEHLRTRGRIDLKGRLLHIDELEAYAEGGEARAVLTFDLGPEGPRMSGAAHIGPATADVLLGVWPAIMAYDPRNAVSDTIRGGMARAIDIELALTREDLDGDPTTHNPHEGALSIDATFVGATLGAPELPVAVRRARGALRLRDRVLSVQLDAGVIAADEGGELALSNAAFTIPDLGLNPAEASITATVAGPLAAVVGLATHVGIAEIGKTRVTPADVSGTVTAEVAVVTPLGPTVSMADRRWSIEATLVNAATTVPLGGQTFTDANVTISANSRRLAARGRAKIAGLSIDVNYTELFSGEKSGAARFVLTDKDRRDRGFDTGETVRGPVVVTLQQGEDGATTFEADLTEAAVAVLGLDKAVGRSLVAVGVMRGEPPDVALGDLAVDGSGVAIAGSANLANGKLQRAEFPSFGLSEGDKARVSVGGAGDGYRIDIEAAQFDARRVLESATSGGGATEEAEGGGPALTITARGQRVRLTEATHLSDLVLEASHDGQRLQRLAASGRIDGVNAGTFGVRVVPTAAGQRRVQADVAELGRLAAALDVYERMRGGRTSVDARMADDGTIVGQLTVGDFQLADERTLEEIIASTRRTKREDRSPQPLAFQAEPADPGAGGLSFDRMVVDFEKRGERILVTDAILRGQLLGGTANGEIDLAKNTVTLNGTLIPAFGVNNLFGRVPVVGTILGAGEGGGLIGVTFRLEGSLDDPKLSWNPLSAVAPGIFRRIFEYR